MKIQKTTDYSQFKKLTGNRHINKNNLNKIIKSMQQKFLIRPIDINEHYEIIDGQHRTEACKQLGQPVYYIIQKGLKLEDAQRMNSAQKNWSTITYLEGYCDLEKENYIAFNKVYKNYKEFSDTFLISFASGSQTYNTNHLEEFSHGDFKFVNRQEVVAFLEYLRVIGATFDPYRTRSFALAMVKAVNTPAFDRQKFLDKLKFQSTKLVPCVSSKSYLILIEEIYNYHSRGEHLRLF